MRLGWGFIFCNFFMLIQEAMFSQQKASIWVCRMSLLAILEEAMIIFILIEIHIAIIYNVNPLLLWSILGIVLAIDLVLLKMEHLMSQLQSGHLTVSFFPLSGVSYHIYKTTHECSSDVESDSIVLILSCSLKLIVVT